MFRLISIALTMLVLLCACGQPTETPSPIVEAGSPFNLDTALDQLAKFQNYYTEFEISWEGSRDAAPSSGQLVLERLQSRNPDLQEIYATITQSEDTHILAYVQLGESNWSYQPQIDPNWSQSKVSQLDQLFSDTFFTPEFFFDLFTLKVDAPDSSAQRDNIMINSYLISAANFSSEKILFSDAHGQATVSAEGEYLLELDLNAQVEFLQPGPMLDRGEIQLGFRTVETSSPLVISPPTLARQDIPLPADVRLTDPTPVPLSQRQGYVPPTTQQIHFHTVADLLSVAQLYLHQMPDLDWTALTFDLPFEIDPEIDAIPLRFVRENEGVAVRVEDDDGQTLVQLDFGERGTIENGLCNAHADCDPLSWINFPSAPDGDFKLIMSGGGYGQLVYQSNCNAELVQRYYATVMPAENWATADPPEQTDQADSVALRFVRGGEAADIFIRDYQNLTSVEVQSSSPTLDIWGYPGTIDLQLAREFPLTADAELVRLMPGQLAYQSQQSMAEIVEFYENSLSAAGWSAQIDPVENQDASILRYQKEQVTATLLIRSISDQQSWVWVTLYRKKGGEP